MLNRDTNERQSLFKFIEEFAVPFFKICMIIENFESKDYKPYYVDILHCFHVYCENKDSFDGEKHLNDTYRYFEGVIKPFVDKVSAKHSNNPDVAVLRQPIDSVVSCEEVLKKLRELEEL